MIRLVGEMPNAQVQSAARHKMLETADTWRAREICERGSHPLGVVDAEVATACALMERRK